MDRNPLLPDFTEVRLAQPISMDGINLPAGTSGVVMAAYADGLAYEVEFDVPVHVVLTLDADVLRATASSRG